MATPSLDLDLASGAVDSNVNLDCTHLLSPPSPLPSPLLLLLLLLESRCGCQWSRCQSRCRSRCRSSCSFSPPPFPRLLGSPSEIWESDGFFWNQTSADVRYQIGRRVLVTFPPLFWERASPIPGDVQAEIGHWVAAAPLFVFSLAAAYTMLQQDLTPFHPTTLSLSLSPSLQLFSLPPPPTHTTLNSLSWLATSDCEYVSTVRLSPMQLIATNKGILRPCSLAFQDNDLFNLRIDWLMLLLLLRKKCLVALLEALCARNNTYGFSCFSSESQ